MKHFRVMRKRAAVFCVQLLSICALAPPLALAADADLGECDSTVTFAALSGKHGYMNEDYPNLFDNNTQTKWCLTVLASSPAEVVFKASKMGVVKGYTIVTANDNATNTGRNPSSWKLYGGTSADGDWTLVDEVTDDNVMQDVNFTPFTFKVGDANLPKFDHFKWVVTNVKGGTTMQVSEFKVLMVSCEHKNSDGSSALGTVVNSQEATCMECAFEIRRCSICNKEVKLYTGTDYAPHTLIGHLSKEATCTEYGCLEYYECDVCRKLFLDQDCTTETTLGEVQVAPWGHYIKNGVCETCHFVDDRFKTITRHGVDISVHEDPFATLWQYDTEESQIASINHDNFSNSKFEFTLASDSAFQLSFDYGTVSNESTDKLTVIIDGNYYGNLNNVDKSFCYVFAEGGTHTVGLSFAKQSTIADTTCCGYIKNVVASTDIDTTKRVVEMFYTKTDTSLTVKYGPVELPCCVFDDGYDVVSRGLDVKIDASMKNYEIPTLSSFFARLCPSSIEGIENLNTEKVTDMSFMFSGCDYLSQLDLSSLDTKNVTNMAQMFSGCRYLEKIDLSSFNTSKVESMYSMFYDCGSLKQLDLSSFDTQNVTAMESMFERCRDLERLNLSSFNTSKVTNMRTMFYSCSSLKDLNLSSFSTERVENMSNMFGRCDSLMSLDLSSFDSRKVTDMDAMFYRCYSLQQLDFSSLFDTRNVRSMFRMFYYCSSLKQLDLTSFNTKNVYDVYSMFFRCDSLTTIYVSDKFVTDQVRDSHYMFYGCDKLVGATAYDNDKIDGQMANYRTGYFKTYCQTGDIKHELYGDTLALDTLTLVDGELLKINAPFTASIATHERALAAASSANRWGTICLPYAIKAPAACQLYTYGGVTYDASTREHIIVMNEVETLDAGTPAFYCVKDGDVASVTFSATNAAIADTIADNSAASADGLYLQGTFNNLQVEDGYVPKDNCMWIAQAIASQDGEPATVKGLHAYLAFDPEAASAPEAEKLVFEAGVTTSFADIEAVLNSGNVEIYDVNGRRHSSLQPGVNIVRQADGKAVKMLVK